MNTHLSIWILCIVLSPVSAQTPWSFTESDYGYADTGSVNQVSSVRTYRNLLISLRLEGAAICNYYNGASSACVTLKPFLNTVEFFSEGGPTDPIYFLLTVYAPTTQGAVLYQASATPTTVSATVVWNSTVDGYPKIIGVNIDYQHRWMILISPTTLHVFDIRTITKPVRTDSIALANTIGSYSHPRPVSLYKNRVCTVTAQNKKGIQCYSVRQGKITSAAMTFDTTLETKAIRIFDDLIIVAGGKATPEAGLLLYNATSLQKVAIALPKAVDPWCPNDFIRFDTALFAADFCTKIFYFFDITNPTVPVVLYQQASVETPHTLFSDANAIYVATAPFKATSLRKLTNFTVPGDYRSFHEKSEWHNYGSAINTLIVVQSCFAMYYGETSLILPIILTDKYLPDDVTILYTLISPPMTDFVLEILSDTTWIELAPGSSFSQSMLQAGQIRVRYLHPPNPLTLNLNQSVQITGDNGRNSMLNATLSIARVYENQGTRCPVGATCTVTAFECQAGYAIKPNADGCEPCSTTSYKPTSGNSACLPCPPNADCRTGTHVTCPPSHVWNPKENTCDVVSKPTVDFLAVLLSNPLYLGLSIGVAALILLVSMAIAFVCWRSRRQSFLLQNNSFLSTTSNGTTSIFTDTSTRTDSTTAHGIYSDKRASRHSSERRSSECRHSSHAHSGRHGNSHSKPKRPASSHSSPRPSRRK